MLKEEAPKSTESVNPESTIESANRRNFIKKAAMATAAVGIGGTLLGENLIPESSAASAACHTVVTPGSNVVGSLAIWKSTCSITDSSCHGTAAIYNSKGRALTVDGKASGKFVCCVSCAILGDGLLCVANNSNACNPVGVYATAGTATYCPVAPGVTGVLGTSKSGFGVVGNTCNGCGVAGYAKNGVGVRACGDCGVRAFGNNYGVFAIGNKHCSVPLVALSCPCGSANIQEWGAGCFFPLSVVNKYGWLGVGSSTAPTTLHVGGSISARMITETGSSSVSSYSMKNYDFAVLVDAATLPSGKTAFTLTLPPADTATGMIVFIKKTDSSTHGVTVTGYTSSASPPVTDTIESKTTKTLSKQYDSLQLISNGAHNWFIMGNSIGDAFTS
jgi:hypothetical protein